MLNFFFILYIIFSLILILLIFLNSGKGSEISILNQNNELLNSKDSDVFFNRLIIFFILLSLCVNFIIFKMYDSNIKNKKIVSLDKYQVYYK